MGRLRRKPVAGTPLEGGAWQVPARFNFTRDVVETLASDALRPALTFVDREGVIDRRTFKTVAADASRWSALLRSRGLVPGDRLLVYVGRTPVWHSILLGALKAGFVPVPCPDTLPGADAALRAVHSGARLVVADDVQAQKLVASDPGLEVGVLVVEGVSDELREHSVVQPTQDTAADDTALILYTSGTTREPLGAVHTHGYTWAQRRQAESWLDARPGDLVWCTAAFGTAESIWSALLGPWSCGAETVVHDADFDVEQRFDLIERIGVSVLCQAPSEYRRMAKHSSLDGFYIGSVRRAVSTGDPLDRAVAAIFHDAFGLTISDCYGQTENAILVANPPGVPIRPGSIGLPTPGHEVAVIDDEGHEQPVGKEGDIALKGRPPSLFREYWNAPTETRAAFRGDWYITGDRATRNEDGYLWFTGRVGDAILSAAHRINPFEVESALLEHPSVIECVVVGRPVAGRGNLVKALVILRSGVEPSDELVIELQDHVEEVTAVFKVPREIEFVEELPKTTSGKIRRVEFRASSLEVAGGGVATAAEARSSAKTAAVEENAETSKAAETVALEDARRRKKARSAEVAAAAAVEAAARAERRIDLERRTAAALAAEQAAQEEEARRALADEQARLAAEEAAAAEERSRREDEERSRERTQVPAAPKDEPDPSSAKDIGTSDEAATEPSSRAARRETERRRKDEERRRQEQAKVAAEEGKKVGKRKKAEEQKKADDRRTAAKHETEAERRRQEEKAAAEQARRDEAEARRAAAAQAKEDERQRKEDEKRQREEEKAAAEQARRDEAEARRAAAAQAKEDERQRKEDERRQREEEKAAAEQARRDEAEARRAAAAQAKEDERQRKEDEKRQREEEKAAAEQARRDEAEARRAAATKDKEDRDAAAAAQRAAKEAQRKESKSRPSAPSKITEADDGNQEEEEDRSNPTLLARLSEYGHGKDTEPTDTEGAESRAE